MTGPTAAGGFQESLLPDGTARLALRRRSRGAGPDAVAVRDQWRAEGAQDALVVTATLLDTARREVSGAVNHGNNLAADLLGIEGHDEYQTNRLATYVDTHPTKAAHVALAVVIGGVDSSTSRDTWRRPNAEAAKYLNIIPGWGYALSPVEKIAAMIEEATTE